MRNFSVPFNFEDMESNDLQSLSKGLIENWKRAKECIYSGKLISFLKTENPKLAEYLSYIVKNTERYLVSNELEDKKDIGTFIAMYTIDPNISHIYWRGRAYVDLADLASNISNDKTICNLLINSAISLVLQLKNVEDKNLIERIQKIEKFTVNAGMEGAYRFQYEFSDNENIYIDEKNYQNIDSIIEEFDKKEKNLYQFLDNIVTSDSFKAKLWKEGYGDIFQKYQVYSQNDKLVKASLELKLLEEVSKNQKEKVRKYALLKGKYSYIYWLMNHLNYYEYRGRRATALRAKIQSKNINSNMEISVQEKQLEELKSEYHEFVKLMIRNPYDITYGVLTREELEECIMPLTIDAMFLAEINEDLVTLAYIKSIDNTNNLKLYLKNLNSYEEEAHFKFDRFELAFKEQKKDVFEKIKSGSFSRDNNILIKFILVILAFVMILKFVSVNWIETKTITLVDNIITANAENSNNKLNDLLYSLKIACMDDLGQSVENQDENEVIFSEEINLDERNAEIEIGAFDPFENETNQSNSESINFGEQYIKLLKRISVTMKLIFLYPIILGILEIFKGNKKTSNSIEKEIQLLNNENDILNKKYSENKNSLAYQIKQGENVEIFLNEITSKAELVNSLNLLNEGTSSTQIMDNNGNKYAYYIMSIVMIIAIGTFFVVPFLPFLKLLIDKKIVFTILQCIIYLLTTVLILNYVTKNVLKYDFSDWIKQIIYFALRIIVLIVIVFFIIIKFLKN